MKCISLLLIFIITVSISYGMRKGEDEFVRMLKGIEFISYKEFCQDDINDCLFKSEDEFLAFKAMYILNKNLQSNKRESINDQKNIFIERNSKIKHSHAAIERPDNKNFEDAYNFLKEKQFNMTSNLNEINPNNTHDFQINKDLQNLSKNSDEFDHKVIKNLDELLDFRSGHSDNYKETKNLKDLFKLYENKNHLDYHIEKLINSLYISTVRKLEYQVSKIIDDLFKLKNDSNHYNVTKFIEDLYSHTKCNIYNISAIVHDINTHKDKDGVPYYINKMIYGLCNNKTRELEFNLTRLIDTLYGDTSNGYKLSKMIKNIDTNYKENYTLEKNLHKIKYDIEQDKNYNMTRRLLKLNLKKSQEAKLNISKIIKNQLKLKIKNKTRKLAKLELSQHDDFDLASLISDFNDCNANTKDFNHSQILDKYHLDEFNKNKGQDNDYEKSKELIDVDSIKNQHKTCKIDKIENNVTQILNHLFQILTQQNQIILQVAKGASASQCCCNSCSKNHNQIHNHSHNHSHTMDPRVGGYIDSEHEKIKESRLKSTINQDHQIKVVDRELKSRENLKNIPKHQKSNYIDKKSVLKNENVHDHTSNYIHENNKNHFNPKYDMPSKKNRKYKHTSANFDSEDKIQSKSELSEFEQNKLNDSEAKTGLENFNNKKSDLRSKRKFSTKNSKIINNKDGKVLKTQTSEAEEDVDEEKNCEINNNKKQNLFIKRVPKFANNELKKDHDLNEDGPDSENLENNDKKLFQQKNDKISSIKKSYLAQSKADSTRVSAQTLRQNEKQNERSKILLKNFRKLDRLTKNNISHFRSSINKNKKFAYINKDESEIEDSSDSNNDDYHDEEECRLHYKIHVHTLKDFFENFIEGYKSIPSKGRKFIRGGKIFKIEETFNAYFFCKKCKLNTGIKAYYIDMLKDSLKNLGIRNFKSDISQITKQLKILNLAIGDRCQGIDTILELITKDSEYIQIENQMDLNQVAIYKRDALKNLNNGLYDKAGYNLGQIYGILKNFPKC
jgi:hypothetical protein